MKNADLHYSAENFRKYLNEEYTGHNRLKYLVEVEEELIKDLLMSETFTTRDHGRRTTDKGTNYEQHEVFIHTPRNTYRVLYIQTFDYAGYKKPFRIISFSLSERGGDLKKMELNDSLRILLNGRLFTRNVNR